MKRNYKHRNSTQRRVPVKNRRVTQSVTYLTPDQILQFRNKLNRIRQEDPNGYNECLIHLQKSIVYVNETLKKLLHLGNFPKAFYLPGVLHKFLCISYLHPTRGIPVPEIHDLSEQEAMSIKDSDQIREYLSSLEEYRGKLSLVPRTDEPLIQTAFLQNRGFPPFDEDAAKLRAEAYKSLSEPVKFLRALTLLEAIKGGTDNDGN